MASNSVGMRLDRPAAVPPADERAPEPRKPVVGKRTLVELVPAYARGASDDSAPRGPVIQRALAGGAAGGEPWGHLLGGLTGTGGALPEPVAARMSRLFGHHLAHVCVHTDGAAATAARQLGARAFTIGDDVYFGAGEYAPGTAHGDRLLVHELTHVVQFDRGQLASGALQLSRPDDATEREASAMEGRSDELLAVALPEAQRAAAPELPPQTYRAAAGLVQRAIGFEIQTHFVVRRDGVDWLPYQLPVFEDRRGNDHYFNMVVDHAPVPQDPEQRGEMHARDSAVLELVLPHVEQRADLHVLARRADIMRRALATATGDGTRETTIEVVVAQFEALLGVDKITDDATERAAGIRLPGAIVGQRGEPASASTVLPQFTMGVSLAAFPIVLQCVVDQGMLIDDKFKYVATFMMETLTLFQPCLPLDTLGLALLVETYLHCGRVLKDLEYPKEIAPWMARTDFHSMYLSLSEEGKLAWKSYVDHAVKAKPDGDTIQGGFPTAVGSDDQLILNHGPKIHDWVDSISAPEQFPLAAIDHQRVRDRFYAILAYHLNEIAEDLGDLHERLIAAKASPELLALEAAVRTPSPDRAMPVPSEVAALFGALGCEQLGTEICAVVQDIENALQRCDLMSRGEVRKSAGSMGSMPVPDRGLEQDMAILENRMMPPWQTAPVTIARAEGEERTDPPTWFDQVTQSFDFLQQVLAEAAKITNPDPDEELESEPGPEGGPGREDGPDAEPGARSPGPGPRKRGRSPDRDRSPEGETGSGSGEGPRGELGSWSGPEGHKRMRPVGRVVRDDHDHPIRVEYDRERLRVIGVDADGDCLYACGARFLGDGSDVQTLRALLGQSTLLTSQEQHAALQPGAYAGDRELAALAAALQIAIITYEGTYENSTVVRGLPVGVATRGTMQLLHLYNPAEAQGHFHLLA